VNYIRLANQVDWGGNPLSYHSTFNVGQYDAPRADAVLARLQQDGYNVVRVFLNGCCADGTIGNPSGGLTSAYIANLADFLTRAKARGVFVMITTDGVPLYGGWVDTMYAAACCTYFDGENMNTLTGAGAYTHSRFWQTLIVALKAQNAPLDAVFAYELRSELSFYATQAPFTLTAGIVTTGNGKTYDLSSTTDRQKMMDENLTWWTTRVRTAIADVDADRLVTVGFFEPQGPNPSRIGDPRLIEPYPAIALSTADFVDLHAYDGWGLTIDQYAQNFGEEAYLEKPVIMGEFSAVKNVFPSVSQGAQALIAWQTGSCAHGFGGWLLWAWDEYEPAFPLWTMTSADSSVERALAPVRRADPCSP